MHTKNHENCSQIECFMSQKPLAPKFLSQNVRYPLNIHDDDRDINGSSLLPY